MASGVAALVGGGLYPPSTTPRPGSSGEAALDTFTTITPANPDKSEGEGRKREEGIELWLRGICGSCWISIDFNRFLLDFDWFSWIFVNFGIYFGVYFR